MLKKVEQTGNPCLLFQELKARLQSLKRRKFQPYYRVAFEVAREIEDVISSAQYFLMDKAPDLAWEVFDILLRSDSKLLYSVDDSYGAVGGAYDELPNLWVQAAEKCGKPVNHWVKKIERVVKDDEFGLRGKVLQQSRHLVGVENLKRHAKQYKEKTLAEKAKLPTNSEFLEKRNMRHNAHLLQCCAIALEDPFLYEEGEALLYGREPKGAQLYNVVKTFIQFNEYAEAEKRLDESDVPQFEPERLGLLQKVYEATDQKEKLLEILKTCFHRAPSKENLHKLLEILPDAKKEQARHDAIQTAQKDSDTSRAVRLLLGLGKDDVAEKVLISRQESLPNAAYPWALNLIPELEDRGLTIGVVLCLRALLVDILDRGFYKGYPYAARYFRKLCKMNKKHEANPSVVPDHEAFVEMLRRTHGKKSSFWKRVEQ